MPLHGCKDRSITIHLPLDSCPVITIYLNLSPTAKDIPVSAVISRHHHLTLLTSNYVIVDFEMAVAILATLKISECLIDGLID